MSLNAVAKNHCFIGLKCAYTGKPLVVRVIAHGRSMPRYFVENAYDPSIPIEDMAECMLKLSERDGVIGAVEGERAMTCPYTGTPMTLCRSSEGFYFTGGMNIKGLYKSPEILAEAFLMRDGKLTRKVEPVGTVSFSGREMEEPPQKIDSGLSDEALEATERLAVSMVKRPTTVVVPEFRKGRKK